MDCSPPGYSFHGISQARILEWVAIPFSRGSSWPRGWTWVLAVQSGRQILYHWSTQLQWKGKDTQKCVTDSFVTSKCCECPVEAKSFRKLGTRARPQWCKYRGAVYHIVVQVFRCVWLFVTPQTGAHQAPLSFTASWSLLKFMSSELVMLSNHLILCHPLLLLPARQFIYWNN